MSQGSSFEAEDIPSNELMNWKDRCTKGEKQGKEKQYF